MGVYINTFRTENKTALFNGQTVSVYASRFLCRLGDEDDRWNRPTKRGRLLRANMERAESLFAERKPQFIAPIFEKDWEGAAVYSNPKSAIWYDCDSFDGTLVGFLTKMDNGWAIVPQIIRESNPIICNVTVKAVYTDMVVDGKMSQEPIYYMVGGKMLGPKEFEQWKTGVETAWHEEYKAKLLARQRDAEAAAAEHVAKTAAKNAEIARIDVELNQLNRRRAELAGY